MHDMKIRHKENCGGWKCRTRKCGTRNARLENARPISMKSEQTHIA